MSTIFESLSESAAGGSGKQFVLRAGNGRFQLRAMTAREYARLQGVDDKYPIAATRVQALAGFGDAVCVPVISWIAEHLLNPLAGRLASAGRPRAKDWSKLAVSK